MKKLAALAFLMASGVAAHAQPSVGISIGINQPGVYGRVDIGAEPPPPVVYAQPMLVAPSPLAARRRPIYLYVPPLYQRDWPRYCARYAACGQPVYFVREDWVRDRWGHAHERHDDRDFHGRDPHDRRHDDRR